MNTNLASQSAPALAPGNIGAAPLSTTLGVINAVGTVMTSVASNPAGLPTTTGGWIGFAASLLMSLGMMFSR